MKINRSTHVPGLFCLSFFCLFLLLFVCCCFSFVVVCCCFCFFCFLFCCFCVVFYVLFVCFCFFVFFCVFVGSIGILGGIDTRFRFAEKDGNADSKGPMRM